MRIPPGRGHRHGHGGLLWADQFPPDVDPGGLPDPGLSVARQPRAEGRYGPEGPGDAYGIPEGICVGDPDRLVAVIQRWESIGVDGINFLLNACETVPQADVLQSMRLFATEVMPAFRPATSSVPAAGRSV